MYLLQPKTSIKSYGDSIINKSKQHKIQNLNRLRFN